MNVKSMFSKVSKNGTHVRISSKYLIEIFFGLDVNGKYEMVIRCKGRKPKISSSKIIDVMIECFVSNEIAIHFILQENNYLSIFYKFCEDMASYVESYDEKVALSATIKRWKEWNKMFSKKKKKLLDEKEIKGLIGELIILREYFFLHYSENEAIQSWLGPLGGHKDFEIDDTWYEVKTKTSSALMVEISSLEQLDSDRDGHLVVVSLDSTSPVSIGAINLNLMVASVMSLFSDPDNMELFITRLSIKGYTFEEEYEKVAFFHRKTDYYYVNDSFPKLIRSQINPGIGKAEYSIILNSIQDHKVIK